MTNSLEHLTTLSRRFTELLDSGDWPAVERHVSSKVTARVGGRTLDYAGWLAMGKMFYSAFPDGTHRIERQIAEDDTVVTIASWGGTHRGELMGMPATGRKVEMRVILVDRFEDGLIVEHWGEFDSAGMMQQLTG